MTVDCHYAIVTIDRQLFAIAVRDIREMIVMPEVAGVPDTPAHIRGVCSLRGGVFPIVDTRVRMGRRSAREEMDAFCALMRQREQDHVSWLEELDRSVMEDRKFKLTLDPHQCAFGKWYDAFESKDTLISALLRKFDAPHKRIHQVGVDVREHLVNNNVGAAKALIEREQVTTLSEMKGLFASMRTLICEQQREMAVVITARKKMFVAAVDGLVSVESLRSEDIGPLPPGLEHGGIASYVARRDKTNELVLILARSSTSNRRGAGERSLVDVQSKHKYCGSTAESNLDIATGVQPANTGEYPALSDPVLVVGSITLRVYCRLFDAAGPQSLASPADN